MVDGSGGGGIFPWRRFPMEWTVRRRGVGAMGDRIVSPRWRRSSLRMERAVGYCWPIVVVVVRVRSGEETDGTESSVMCSGRGEAVRLTVTKRSGPIP